MDFTPYQTTQFDAIKTLFTKVFSDAEGDAEGALIGHLVSELHASTSPEDLFCFIAQDQTQIVGALLFSRLRFADDPVNAFILAPVAIATAWQKQGIGQKLIQFGLTQLKQNKVELIFTYGDPNFYCKVGFQPISEQVAPAPLTLSYPTGWLAQSLISDHISPLAGPSHCVSALNDPRYW